MDIREFITQAEIINITITQEMAAKLEKFGELLAEANRHMNLTAITDPGEIVEKHFFDSILPLSEVSVSGNICDVGTGAGFPGLVWAIVCPDLEITLLEASAKKCRFLEKATGELGLKNTEVINERAEIYALTNRETFAGAVSRAVARLNILAELCLPLVKEGGLFVAMKGAKGEAEAVLAQKAVKTLGGRLYRQTEQALPAGDKRVNLFYRKEAKTPAEYPRSYARIRKNPL